MTPSREPTVTLAIGNTRLPLPIHRDAETTRHIADLVNTRLHEIESGSARIDTQTFALLAAYSLARDLVELQEAASEQEEALLESLKHLVAKLTALLEVEDEESPS